MKIIIAGNGKVGYAIASQLAGEKHDITVVDPNPDALRKADTGWIHPLRRFVIVSIVLFAAFFPVLHGIPVSERYFRLLRWLPGWPI